VRKIQRLAAVGAMGAMIAMAGACGGGEGPTTGLEAPGPAGESPGPTLQAPRGTGTTQVSDIFGPACSEVPPEGEGSPQGMVDSPVVTAASNNPLLTTLTKAVNAANLADTLNKAQGLTVFAPADSAFQAFEAKNPGMLNQLTTASDAAQPNSTLVQILKYHVVGNRYDAEGIVERSTLTSLQGGKINVGGTAEAPTVNGAPVLCGNIPTQNATVFVIGEVLSPPATP
jgi:uncharacterized surface protein with fasciclin (FAS1) repeats